MVGDADLQIYQEKLSVRGAIRGRWFRNLGHGQTARRARIRAHAGTSCTTTTFRCGNIAKIPTCDIIDFDYPAWHTTADVPQNCSGESMAKVGWVVLEWLKMQKGS